VRDEPTRTRSRREFLVLGGGTVAAVTLADLGSMRGSGAATTGCSGVACTTTKVWMLDPDWGYARGPSGKTRLVSRASRLGAANRIARTQPEALDMNLHKCSYAPAISVDVCKVRADAAFATFATDWDNPWNGTTVSVLDLRRVPADHDPFACPASSPIACPTSPAATTAGSSSPSLGVKADGASSGPLAFTGSADRRLLFLGAGAVAAGTLLRALGGRPRTPADEVDTSPID
jgi:hypothetical protein